MNETKKTMHLSLKTHVSRHVSSSLSNVAQISNAKAAYQDCTRGLYPVTTVSNCYDTGENRINHRMIFVASVNRPAIYIAGTLISPEHNLTTI